MKKNIVTAIVLLIAIVGGWYLATRPRTVPEDKTQINAATFYCDGGKTIAATFYEDKTQVVPKEGEPPIPGGSVSLAFSDGRAAMMLRQTLSADGARYANADESFIFWNKGNGVMVLENDKEKNYTGCMVVASQPAGSSLSAIYNSTRDGFSLRTRPGYVADATYEYQMTPEKSFRGVKFTIPAVVADGTNLAHDTYISVESLPGVENCTADLFLYDKVSAKELTEAGTTYSYATTVGAGAGNRYEETIYALSGSNPCRAVRYFVHYGVFENYPTGAVKEFDHESLIKEFDLIRSTLTLR